MAFNNTDQVPRVLVNRVSEQAVFPSEFILTSAKTITVGPSGHPVNGGGIQVPTDLRFTVPVGVHLQIAPIPEISEQSIEVLETFILYGIDNMLSVEMHSRSRSEYEIKAGDPIARLVTLEDRIMPEFVDVTPLLD